jgi:glutamate racemase
MSTPKTFPIGVFDSGVGGLTILKEIKKELPGYDFIYLGDNARAPYGTRSFEVVYEYTLAAVKKLFEMGCPLVIIACNTASAKALRTIQQTNLPIDFPGKKVLGVIRPTTENIHRFTQSKHIGILATPGTVNSNSYEIEIKKLAPEITVVQQACPLWVPLIENKENHSPGGEYFIKKYIEELLQKDAQIDTIVLACTHYPIIINQIRKFVPEHIQIISQGELVAVALQDYLNRHVEIDIQCKKEGITAYFTTENPAAFNEKAEIFMDENIAALLISF